MLWGRSRTGLFYRIGNFVSIMEKLKIILKISDIKYDMLLPMSSTGKKRRGNRLLADELPLLFFPTGRMPCSEETQSVFERVLRDRGNAKRFRGGTAGSRKREAFSRWYCGVEETRSVFEAVLRDSSGNERNQKMADNKIPVICVKDLYKIYRVGESKVRALNGVDFTIYKGEFCAIVGTSGSGKSTLLNMLAGLEKPTKGEIVIAGEHIENKTENQLVRFRREHIGFIFQSFNLLSTMTALENVALPLTFQGVDKAKRLKKASALLDLVKLGKYKNHRPTQMSGGQQQRVGVARALVVDPEIIFADEPTGNLDSNTSKEVMELMQQVVHEKQQTLVMVTHDNHLASFADRIFHIIDGKIVRIDDMTGKSKEEREKEEKKREEEASI